MSEKPRIGTFGWEESNPERLGVYNANYNEVGQLWSGELFEKPWIVCKGNAGNLHEAETYEQAAEFLRGKLVEVP